MERKNTLTLVLILVVVAIIWFMTMYIPKPVETVEVPDTAATSTSAINMNKMCYLKHIDAKNGSDDTYLEVNFKEGGDVIGKFNILPAEKDKLTGSFVGSVTFATTSYGLITVDHTYAAEGSTSTEKRVFRLRENEADISWDMGKTFTQTLPQIDCATASTSVTL